MQAEKVYKSFVEKAKLYLKDLDYYGKHQFKQHPLEGRWSVGQLYQHLIHGTTNYHLKEVRNCLEKRNGQVGGKKTFKGKIVLRFKVYPYKVKGISVGQYEPEQPESPEKIKDDLYKFLKLMNRVAKEIDEAGNLEYKTAHPVFGMLNAFEWYSLIDIHYQHNLKLKKKLDVHVKSKTKELATEQEE